MPKTFSFEPWEIDWLKTALGGLLEFQMTAADENAVRSVLAKVTGDDN